jgi:hypothetical protein
VSKESEREVNIAVGKLGPARGGELKVKTKNATQDLLGKLPRGDIVYLELMMFAAYCSALRDDKKLTDAEKAKLLKEYRAEVRRTMNETQPPKPKKPPQATRIEMDKIKLFERYAYGFDNYLDSTNEPRNMSRIIEQGAVLRRRYNPNEGVRLTLGIENGNGGIPLEQARLQVLFEDRATIQSYGRWEEQEVNSRYSSKFHEKINNTPLNADSVFVRFRRPGRQHIKALIDGRYLLEAKRIDFYIDLYE